MQGIIHESLHDTEYHALLAGVMLATDDDREGVLMLADWLDEHDDARADAIRLSCQADADSPAIARKLRDWLRHHQQSFQPFSFMIVPLEFDTGKLQLRSTAADLEDWLEQVCIPILPIEWTLTSWANPDELRRVLLGAAMRPDIHVGISLFQNQDNAISQLCKLQSPIRRMQMRMLNLSVESHTQLMQALPTIQSLNYAWMADFENTYIDAMIALPHLHQLEIIGCANLTDSGFAQLGTLKSLRSLRLVSCHGLTDHGVVGILELPNLRQLELSDVRNLTAKGLLNLPQLTTLESLQIGWATDGGEHLLRQISQMRHLNSLGLHHWAGPLPTWFFAELATWPNLSSLDLYGCPQLTDAALAPMAKSTSLQSLDLSRCRTLSDDTLRNLESVTTLEWLDTERCSRMSTRGRDRLRRVLPGIHVLTARRR